MERVLTFQNLKRELLRRAVRGASRREGLSFAYRADCSKRARIVSDWL
jgi:hypothetical protein